MISRAQASDDANGVEFSVDSFSAPLPWLLRAATRRDRDAWMKALGTHSATLYMNGVLQKKARITKRWKLRYLLLVGPDLHWAKGESKKWLGQVPLLARNECEGGMMGEGEWRRSVGPKAV